MRPDHRQGMGHDGDSGVSVEALEVLPRRLAPVDDGVRMWRAVIGLRSHLPVDKSSTGLTLAIRRRVYSFEFVPLALVC